jgi:hypothetical protein
MSMSTALVGAQSPQLQLPPSGWGGVTAAAAVLAYDRHSSTQGWALKCVKSRLVFPESTTRRCLELGNTAPALFSMSPNTSVQPPASNWPSGAVSVEPEKRDHVHPRNAVPANNPARPKPACLYLRCDTQGNPLTRYPCG